MRRDIAPGIMNVSNVLTLEACRRYIDWSETLGYEPAPVSLVGGAVNRPDVRNNARVIVDSTDTDQELWRRVAADMPAPLDGRRPIGLNERLRFYRYGPGQRFAPHTGGCVRPRRQTPAQGGRRSFVTSSWRRVRLRCRTGSEGVFGPACCLLDGPSSAASQIERLSGDEPIREVKSSRLHPLGVCGHLPRLGIDSIARRPYTRRLRRRGGVL